MSETSSATAAQNEWIKSTLALDLGGEPGGATGPGKGKQKFSFSKKGKGGTGTAPEEGPQPADKDLAATLKTLKEEAAKLAGRGMDIGQVTAEAADVAKAGVKAEKTLLPGPRKKAIDAVKARAKEELDHIKALAKSLDEIAGATDAPTAEQKSEVYKKALKDYYGIEIEVPAGMTNTHFDKVFDMFGSVPKDHVKQDKLKKLRYVDQTGYGGVYYPDECAVEMGDFGDASGEEDYELNGKKVPANSFNVTTLHEIGHSVDEKNGIMTANQGKAGCGGWKSESSDTAAAAYLKDCKKALKMSKAAKDADVLAAIKEALDTGAVTQPDTIGDDDWDKLQKYLLDTCVPARDASQPYFKDDAIAIGDRVFTEASPGEWWSYAKGARTATKVNNYQWRSPAEWFAEVYAISWLKKAKPPSAVDSKAAAYMWKG